MLTWQDITASERFGALSLDEKERVRQSYFDDFVLPNAPQEYDPEELRKAWDAKTRLSRTWGEAASDTAMAFGSGAGGLVEGAGTIYGLVTGEMDNGARTLGKDTQDFYQRQKSRQLQEAEQARARKIGAADGFFEEAGTAIAETVKDPKLLGSFAAEQIPMFVGPGAVGRAGLALGGAKAAVPSAIGAGAAMQAGDVSSDAYDQAKKIALSQGMSPEEADAAALEIARKVAPAAGAVSVASQFLPGGRTIERVLSGAPGRIGMGGVGTGLIRGAMGEGVSEAVEEGFGKVASNVGMQGLDPSIPLGQGAGEAAGMGFLGGVGFGGVAGVAGARKRPPTTEPPSTEGETIASITGAGTVDEAIRMAEAALEGTPALPHYAGPEMVSFPDGTVLNKAEYDRMRADGFTFEREPVLSPVEPAPFAFDPAVQGQQRPDDTEFQRDAAPEAPPIAILGEPEPSGPIETPQRSTRAEYADALAKSQRGELLTSYERTLLDNPPSTPEIARDVAKLGDRELDLAHRLTRSPERREAIAAEMERRATAPEIPPAQEPPIPVVEPPVTLTKDAALDQVRAATAAVRAADASAVRALTPAVDEAGAAAQRAGATSLEIMRAQEGAEGPNARAVESQPARPQGGETSGPAQPAGIQLPAAQEEAPAGNGAQAAEGAAEAVDDFADRRGEVKSFKTERLAMAYQKQNRVPSAYTPRSEGRGRWVLSRPMPTPEQRVQERARREAMSARAKSRAGVSTRDDALTIVGKMGGWKIEDAARDGVDPRTIDAVNASNFRKPFRKNGRLTIDGIAEALASYGFDVYDEGGRPDATKAREIMEEALSGTKVYSPEGREYLAAREAEGAEARARFEAETLPEDLAETAYNDQPDPVRAVVAQTVTDDFNVLQDMPDEVVSQEAISDEELAKWEAEDAWSRGEAGTAEARGAPDGAADREGLGPEEESPDGDELAAPQDSVPEAPADAGVSTSGGFDSEAFDRKRAEAIKESRKTRKHLDNFDRAVEGLRGKRIEYVYDPKEHGEVRSVANTGEVVVWWADKYSADKEMAHEVKDKKGNVIAYESWLMPSDLKDYAVTNPGHRYDANTYKPPKLAKESAKPALELTGETEAEIRTREALKKRDAETSRQRDNAPSEKGFTLTGSDSQVDETRARGQQELVPNKPAQEIADFGEKIGGARKDVWTSFKDKLTDAQGVDVAAEPLSKSWPEPDYRALLDSGADSWAVAFMHAARDEIPRKPSKPWKLKSWVESVKRLRDTSLKLATGELSAARARELMTEAASKSRGMDGLASRIELYEAVGHEKSLAGVRVSVGEYSLYGGKEYKPPKTIWSVNKEVAATAFSNWPRELATGATKAEAIEEFKKKYAELEISPPVSKEATFEIYSKRGEDGYWIGKKVGRNPLLLHGPILSIKEARAYKDEHHAELLAKLEKAKETPNERRDTNEPRVGADIRGGVDVTSEMFGETFGFRGVEFGNYVEQGKRQKDLNDAFDALMDMAAILDVPPKALSLNGELGLAFGARGTGGVNPAKAHYEPHFVVINLTKKDGAGSIGHEWWHALDNYFSRSRGETDKFLTEGLDVSLAARQSNFVANTAVRKEMIEAFGAVVRSIRDTALKARSSKLDAKRSKDYWTTGREMSARAFESYLISKLQDQNASNDYLANIVDEATWKAAESLGWELDESYPYPTAGEVPKIRAGFDHFFQTIQTKETDKGVALFRRSESRGGMAADEARSIVNRISAKWQNAPEIIVIDSMAAAPAAVAKENEAQLAKGAEGSPYAFFHGGKVYIVASEAKSPRQVVTGLFHEALGHYGLRGVFGDQLEPILAQVASARRADVEAKAKEYGLDMDVRKDRLIAAEEVLAELAQTRPNIGFVRRAVAKLRSYLRGLGLDLEMTDDDIIANFILPARGWVERGRGRAEGDSRFARTGKEDMAKLDLAMRRMDEMVSMLEKGALKPETSTHLGDTPPALQLLGAPDSKLYINGAVLLKVLEHKHGWQMSPELVRQIPAQLFEPMMVFDAPGDSGFIVVTELADRTGHQVIVPIHLSVEEGRIVANRVASIYGLEDGTRKMEQWAKEGRLAYYDKSKTATPSTTLRLSPEATSSWRVPHVVQAGVAARKSVKTDEDLVNQRGAMFARTPAWAEADPALKSAAAKVDTYAPDKTIKEKAAVLVENWKERLVQGMFDSYAPLKRLGPKEYVLARMVKAADGALEGTLLHGKPVMGDDGVIRGEIDQKGFLGAMQELQGEHDRFFLWVAGNRAERLMREGREHLFTEEEIKAMKGLIAGKMKSGDSRPQAYAKAGAVLQAYNKAVLDIAEKTGLIDGEARHLWEHDYYVPFFRMDEDMKIEGPSKVKGLVRQQAFKKLKGGTEPLGDLLDNTLRNWQHLLSASMANQAAVASLKAAQRIGIAREVDEGTKGATYAMVDGKKIHYEVDDAFVLTAISAMESASFNGLPMKVMGKAKHYLTLGVTVSPTFRIRNLLRDSISAIGQNEMSYNALMNVAKGYKGTNRKGDQYAQMLFNGALMRFGQLTDGKHAEHAKRLIASGVDDSTILTNAEKTKAAINKAWDEWQEFGDRMENVNRAALYQKMKADGMSDRDAAFAARDMLDFSLQGSWTAVRFLTQIVPFMNARLQGLYKMGRAAKENPARLGYVSGAVALASIALLLAYQDDDEWKKREDWDRDNFWWFRIGKTAYRIPKPFEIGAIGTLAERSVELLISDEMNGKRYRERLTSMLGDTFALNPTPQLFKPMVDLYSNKDSFTGRQIESRGMQNKAKEDRATPYTSLVARLIGKTGTLSPAQADHVIHAYFGWLGAHLAMTVDLIAQPMLEGSRPARRLEDYFVVGDFVKDLPASRSRYVEQFYKQAQEVHEVMGSLKEAREAKDSARMAEILKDKRAEVGLSHLYSRAEHRMGELNAQMRRVHASSRSGEERRRELDRLTSMRNDLARMVDERARERREAAGQ